MAEHYMKPNNWNAPDDPKQDRAAWLAGLKRDDEVGIFSHTAPKKGDIYNNGKREIVLWDGTRFRARDGYRVGSKPGAHVRLVPVTDKAFLDAMHKREVNVTRAILARAINRCTDLARLRAALEALKG